MNDLLLMLERGNRTKEQFESAIMVRYGWTHMPVASGGMIYVNASDAVWAMNGTGTGYATG